MAYNQLLSVTAIRYKDGIRSAVWVTRFDRRAWEKSGKNPDLVLHHIESRRYDWNSHNLRRLRSMIPDSWRVEDRSTREAWRSTWRIPRNEVITATDW